MEAHKPSGAAIAWRAPRGAPALTIKSNGILLSILAGLFDYCLRACRGLALMARCLAVPTGFVPPRVHQEACPPALNRPQTNQRISQNSGIRGHFACARNHGCMAPAVAAGEQLLPACVCWGPKCWSRAGRAAGAAGSRGADSRGGSRTADGWAACPWFAGRCVQSRCKPAAACAPAARRDAPHGWTPLPQPGLRRRPAGPMRGRAPEATDLTEDLASALENHLGEVITS